MKNILILVCALFMLNTTYSQCTIDIPIIHNGICGNFTTPAPLRYEIGIYDVLDCNSSPYVKNVLIDSIVLNLQSSYPISVTSFTDIIPLETILNYDLIGQYLYMPDPCPLECYVICSRLVSTCQTGAILSLVGSNIACSQGVGEIQNPIPSFTLDSNGFIVGYENGNCPDESLIRYKYNVTDLSSNTLIYQTSPETDLLSADGDVSNFLQTILNGIFCQ